MIDPKRISSALNKTFSSKGRESSIGLASDTEESHEYISTCNLSLDLALGGGIAWGYSSEFIGKSGSGKTLMLQLMLAHAQKNFNAIGLWFDRENAWFNNRAAELGINLDRVILAKPQDIITVKDMEDIAVKALEKVDDDDYVFIAVDSISAFAKEGEKADMGKKAQSLHDFFRKLLPFIDSKKSLNFANQRTFMVGVMFGDPSTSTGGEGPKYYNTYRIKIDDKKAIKDSKRGDEIIGNWINTHVIKTRFGPNHREVSFPFYYKEGIPYYGGYVRLLADRNYVKPNNKKEFWSYNQRTVKYKDKEYSEFNVEKLLEDNPELLFDTWPEYYNEDDVKEESILDYEVSDDKN